MGISNGVAERGAVHTAGSEDEAQAESEMRPKRDSAQSGVRAAHFDARLDAALAATERTETTLADLSRTVKFLSATIGMVRDANKALSREFESLAATVVGERTRLLSEHDEFIAMLLADHDRELSALRRRLAEFEGATPPEKTGEA